jgi:cytochrome c
LPPGGQPTSKIADQPSTSQGARLRRSAIFLLVAGLALSACNQSSSGSSASEGTAAPPPPPPTDAQAKAMVAALPAPFNTGDYEAGKAAFTQCAACHTTAQGGPNMTGPNLYGIFGRKAGTAAGFDYSDALKGAGWTWDAARINQWITNPRAVLPQTKMSFIGLADAKDRINVIAYLKVATSPAPAS